MKKSMNPLKSEAFKQDSVEGILLIDKPKGKTSFYLVSLLRKHLGVKKIGHAGTLDPFATGVMVLLVGRNYTRLSDQFLCNQKAYSAQVYLGVTTDTYDCDGTTTAQSSIEPTLEEIKEVILQFQGEIQQIPPMYSAKKIDGKKLYELARKGQVIERQPVTLQVDIKILSYTYPYLELDVSCSKGTYIRSLAHDIGEKLGCGAHLTNLQRTQSGQFQLEQCISVSNIQDPTFDISNHFIKIS